MPTQMSVHFTTMRTSSTTVSPARGEMILEKRLYGNNTSRTMNILYLKNYYNGEAVYVPWQLHMVQ